MQVLQDIISLARNLRADQKVDPKLVLEGTLYSHSPAGDIAKTHLDAIRKLGNVNLKILREHAPQNAGAVRSTPEFDLVLELPELEAGAQRERLLKEKDTLEKGILSHERQLSDESFRAKAPAKVIAGMQQKLDTYKAQLAKVMAGLGNA